MADTPVFNIEEELKKLPAKPGVYLMHNALDEVIYVGKAKVLKNRVRQYFQSSRGKTAKILKMVSNIDHFEYIVTDSETEALVLECNLIKEYRPRYNTMLMDDKGYPYIRVTVEEDYPRVFMSRIIRRDKSLYFGPYTSAFAVKETLELLQMLFRIRTCRKALKADGPAEKPCLNYHIGLCSGPCAHLISVEDYRESIDRILRFLNGDSKDITADLERKMREASEAENYEEALRCRDLLNAVAHVTAQQKITDVQTSEDRDFIALAKNETDAVVSVFFVRDGKLMGRDHFHMRAVEKEDRAHLLSEFVKQYYAGTPFIPKEIFLQEAPDEQDIIAEWLSAKRSAKVTLFVPKRGQKEKFMELAYKNAQMVLDQDKEKLKREEARTFGALRELEELTGIPGIRRMEAFDISNISGFESVGSMVVFEDGKPKKNDYRKFRIKTVAGPDDYASMEEVLTRRFRRALDGDDKFARLPDVLMMDGGKGQVHVAERVLEALGLEIPVCGMVKDDHHNTRGLYYRDVELPIDTHSEGFHLITRIQDEAHRFAITYHRGLHTQNSIRSVLSGIPGIGPKREKTLIRSFESIDRLKEATAEEIAALDGFNKAVAGEVWAFLHDADANA